ncbi:unnamed protein product [Adineta steineri]|uniref:Nuclear receptor n=2 Tax=Adineta steineri TaxID=433720 RepID=A0A815LLI4_9BILA|nr:unnamed protein product [Adineta steineri]CAF3703872.1 unnamed protein product [Adineta steineri]
MLSNVSLCPSRKRRRIMIITADDNIIDEIEKTSNMSLIEQIVLPSQDNNNKRSNQQNTVKSFHPKNKSKNGSLICVVCESSATGYNFGAIACESCKAFFRRHAREEPTTLHCNDKNDCKITSETRRNCSACRLAKCFSSGMQSDRLSTIEQKAEKHRQTEENRKLALNLKSKINEKEIQLSSLTYSDTLIPSIDTNILFTDFTHLLQTQTLLSSEDIQRIETISNSYHNRIEFAARSGLPWNPSIHTKTFVEVLNSRSVPVMRLLSYFKQIPEFDQLNVDDKVTLIKHNLITILGISRALSYKSDTHDVVESDSDVPLNTQFYRVLYGYHICKQLHKIFHSFVQIAQYDRKIIELILIILILTKGFSITNYDDEQILNDNMSVYRAHNYYTELLWKYMETIYGYKKAIDLFSQLILNAISWQQLQYHMRNDILKTLSPDDTKELLPIMKSILRIS